MRNRILSLILAVAILLSLALPVFAAVPDIQADQLGIYMEDVRVEKNAGGKTPVKVTLKIQYGTDFTVNSGSGRLNFVIPSATTGITDTEKIKIDPTGAEDGDYRYTASSAPNPVFVKTGEGYVNFASIRRQQIAFAFTLPNITETTKIGFTAQDFAAGTLTTKIDANKVITVPGSVIVQYPVTVKVDGNLPANASISVNTTEYDTGKNTYNAKGEDTPLTNGDKFWVDSGDGQQNTPVLNITVPEGYRAQVKIGDGTYEDAANNYSLQNAITAATEVSVKFIEGTLPVSNIAVTDKTGPYTLAAYSVDRNQDGSQGNTIVPQKYEGYRVVGYKLDSAEQKTIAEDGNVQIDLAVKNHTLEFIYERAANDNSVVVPGPDQMIAPPYEKDNVTIKPTDSTKAPTVDGEGKVTVPEGGGSVIGGDGSTVVVPEGTVVDKDGNVTLPGTTGTIKPGQTDSLPAGFYKVTYKSTEGTGKLPEQIAKFDTPVTTLSLPTEFQPATDRAFVNWNEREGGSGTPYEPGATITRSAAQGNLTLYAQWKDDVNFGENQITVTYHSNDGSNKTAVQVAGAKLDTTFTITLKDGTTFALEGWTLAGWNEQANGNGATYKLSEQINRTKTEGNLDLYAQWIKVGSNSITVPGSDNKPGTDKDATANGDGTTPPTRNEETGIITVPAGGKVTTDAGKTEYPMPGGGTLKPDGTITIKDPDTGKDIVIQPGKDPVVSPTDPDAATKKVIIITYESGVQNIASVVKTAIVDKDGGKVSVVSGDTLFARGGYKFAYWKNGDNSNIVAVDSFLTASTTLTANWYAVDKDGNITVPKQPDGAVVVKPDPTDPDKPDKKPSVDENGNVVVPPGGEVETKPGGGTTTLPDGGKVNPDGEIVVPDPDKKPDGTVTIDPSNPAGWPEGWFTVAYDKNDAAATGSMGEQLVKAGSAAAMANSFDNKGKDFVAWNISEKGTDTMYQPGDKITAPTNGKKVTLYAIWSIVKNDPTKPAEDGSITVPGPDGKLGSPDDVTIRPNGNQKPAWRDDKRGVTVPDGGRVELPGGNVIVPPNGSWVKPDGTIVLPDNKTIDPETPSKPSEDYVTITFKPNKFGTGTMPVQYVKTTKDTNLLANGFSAQGKVFHHWSEDANDNGTKYTNGQLIEAGTLSKDLVLWAQWVDADAANSATVIFNANDGTDTPKTTSQKIGSEDTTISGKLEKNPFKLKDWTFTGWNTDAGGNGDRYADEQPVVLTPSTELTLFAQWVKQDENGSITVPGGDKKPGTTDDVTVKPNPAKPGEGGKPSVDGDGNVKVPAGGSVVKPGGNEIVLPGGGTVKPDGTVIIPNPTEPDKPGTVVPTDPTKPPVGTYLVTYHPGAANGSNTVKYVYVTEGTEHTVMENTFTYDGHVFAYWTDGTNTRLKAGVSTVSDTATITANWLEQKDDGTIVIPDPAKPGGSIEVKPNPTDPDKKPGVDKDGNIDVPAGGEVVKKPDGGSVELPDGGKVTVPGGEIKVPDGTTIDPNNPGGLPEGWYVVEYRANDGSARGTMSKQVSQDVVQAKQNRFELGGNTFTEWNTKPNGTGDRYAPGDDVAKPTDGSKTVILYAQWRSSTVATFEVNVRFYKDIDHSETRTQLVTGTGSQTTAKLDANTFTLGGWSFLGWSTEPDGTGTFYANNASVVFQNDANTLELYAIWYKQDGDNIVIPGPDGKPGTSDDITVKPNPDDSTKKPEVNPDGSVKVPDGGKIEIPGKNPPTDDKTITVKPGATVKPDGTITIPDGGTAKIEPDGTTITGPAEIKPDGKTENPDPDKPYRPGDGTIVLPGKDGKTGTDDDVKVTPDKDGSGKDNSTIDKGTGNVTLPDGGTVKYPDEPNGNGSTVIVPGSTVIKPDGSVVLPDGKDATVVPGGDKLPGGSEIGPDGEVKTYAYTVKFSGVTRADEVVKIAKGVKQPIPAPAINGYDVDKAVVTVTGGELVDGGYIITFTYTKTSGGTIIVNPSNPSKPSQPSQPTDPAKNPTTGVTLPEYTGVNKQLETTKHNAYMSGVRAGIFDPNANMTRAQVARMFYNLLVNKSVAVTTNFSDVEQGKWYTEAVNALASLGIIQGSNGKFRPNDPITRAEFIAIAMRFANMVSGASASFKDVPTNAWYYDSIASAVAYGWIGGYSDGSFRPTKPITRAEVVTIVNRMLNRSFDASVSLNAVTNFSDVPVVHWAFAAIAEATTSHDHTSNNGVETWTK